MARESITQAEVFAAADRLVAGGTKPTLRAVRSELGRGSSTTVLRYLQAWLAKRPTVPDTPLSLPINLQLAVVDFVCQEVAAAKTELSQELENAQLTTKDLMLENEAQAAELLRQTEALDLLQAEHQQLHGRCEQLIAESLGAQAAGDVHRKAAEAARTDVAMLQVKLESLPAREAEVSQLRASLDTERAARVNAEQSAAVATARNEQAQESLAELRARLIRTEEELREIQKESGRLRDQVGTLQGALQSTQAELVQAKEEARRAEAFAAEAASKLALSESTRP